MTTVVIKRVYEPPTKSDGKRYLERIPLMLEHIRRE
jgi:uncharacterized protein YeaO (DUF488 family)